MTVTAMGLPAEVLDRTEELLAAPCQAPAFKVPDPSPRKRSPYYVPGVRFDLDRVARVVAVADHLVHIKGEWRGKQFAWEPWQVQHIIAPMFGWVVPHDSPRQWVRVRRAGYIETGRKNGKALALDTPIPTPCGWTTMSSVSEGMEVLTPSGVPAKIIYVSPVRIGHDCYRVEFSDGGHVVADAEHLWSVQSRRRKQPETLTTVELLPRVQTERTDRHEHMMKLPQVNPVELPEIMLPVDPYTLGVWLGDGHTSAGRVTNMDPEVWAGIASGGWSFGVDSAPDDMADTRTVYGLIGHLHRLGVSTRKRIPAMYLRGSLAQRWRLLQGIVDSDGHIARNPNGSSQVEVTLTLEDLAQDVAELVRMLGLKPSVRVADAVLNGRVVGSRYRVLFAVDRSHPAATIARKLEARAVRPLSRARNRYITAVTRVASVPVRCIEVDHPDSLYLAGPTMVPTHNTTGASVLAINALTADDEPAPEVTVGAFRKKQARRLFEPARDMMLASPRLSSRVRSITDLVRVPRNGGEFTIASSEADSEHGGNIHQFFVDELHVLPNADLLEILETGTGARVQPIGWIFTTADQGDAGTVYDQRRREIEALATGAVDWEPTTYGAVWCAGDADDPFAEESWRKANPNLGVTITLEYMQREAEKARRNPQYLPTFERLHLGKRRRTEARWLPIDYYQACDHGRTFDDLVGADVWGAVDLSAVDDFTALVWWCPRRITSPAMGDVNARRVEGGIAVARIWCTESGVRRRPRMARQLETWQRNGWLTITPGDAIDYNEISTQLLSDGSVFGALKGVGFDPWNARQFAQELQDDHGVSMTEVPQTMKSLAGGAQRLEQLVLQRAIATDGNPVLRWMVSNTVARRDPDNRVRPDKKRSGQKIDAVSAWVSALAVWLDDENLPDIEDQFA